MPGRRRTTLRPARAGPVGLARPQTAVPACGSCRGWLGDNGGIPAVYRNSGGGVRGTTVLIMLTYRQPGTVITERTFAVPLDHDKPEGEQIEIFGREVVAADNPAAPGGAAELPWLLFL